MNDNVYAIGLDTIINHYQTHCDESSPQCEEMIYDYLISNHGDNFKNSSKICVYAFNEAFGGDDVHYMGIFSLIFPALRSIVQKYDNLDNNILVLGNYTFDRAKNMQFVADLEFITVEPFRLYTFFQNNYNLDYTHKPISKLKNNQKFLCKFGKVNMRWNSYVLLNFLRDLDLLNPECGEWSFVYEDSSEWYKIYNTMYKKIHGRFMPNTPKMTHKEFVSAFNMLDDFTFGKECNSEGQFFYTGFPFDVKHHEDTQFTIVRETSLHNNFGLFPTEKTWIPISVKHPILLFGQPSLAYYLEKSGYLAPDDFQLSKKILTAKTYQQGLDLFKESYDKMMTISESDMEMIADNNYKQFCKDVDKDIEILLSQGKFINANTGMQSTALEIVLRNHFSNNMQRSGKPDNTNFDYDTINKLYPDK